MQARWGGRVKVNEGEDDDAYDAPGETKPYQGWQSMVRT
jgi:hypothetical protein